MKKNTAIALHMASILALSFSPLSDARSAESSRQMLAATSESSTDESEFNLAVNRFFDFKFKANPDWATILGFHQYDKSAPDYSQESIENQISELKSFEKQFDSFQNKRLAAQSQIDLQLIKSTIKADLLSLSEIKDWQRNPDTYSSQSSSMIYDLISRDFAPIEERLKSVIAREKKIPSVLEAGKKNLRNPPKVFTEVALEQLPGIINLFENSVVETFNSVQDEKLHKEFLESNKNVIAALKDYEKHLQEVVLPESKGNFALGNELYAKKLLYEEMEDTPLDDLLAQGEREMERLKSEFVNTAAEIDNTKKANEVFTSISSDHSTPSELIASVSGILKQLKDFCVEKQIISIPQEDNLQVKETPAFMRALTFAAMDAPGPFEEKAKEAYYYVTLPESDWKPERIEEHMRAFCKYDVINTSVHEAFPGHYVQGLWDRQAPSKTSKILGCNSNVEGWAHYCEQMMLEEGLESGNKKLKMVMLHDALLRCARYIVGIRMHCKGMSMEEGINFFINEGFQEKANAERETKRGTMDPTYLVYTLGKLQLIQLREDYRKAKGTDFKLKDFHDRVMATGTPPIKIIREILLGAN